jgi:hypothetical protein
MTRTLLPVFLVSLALAGSAAAQEWKQYGPDGAGYRVEFPGQPVEDVSDVPTNIGQIRMRTSSLTVGDKMFMTITSSYPREVSMGDPQKNLDGARNGSLQNTNGKLLREEQISVNSKPARHLLIDMPQDNLADTILVLDDHQLLQAIYIGPRRIGEPPEARRFLTSFTPVR